MFIFIKEVEFPFMLGWVRGKEMFLKKEEETEMTDPIEEKKQF